MPAYKAPLRDMRFVLYELHGGASLAALPGLESFTPDLIDPVLEEAAKICEQVLQPINRSGDEEGCSIAAGVVRTPAGFKQAYDRFRDGGWTALASDPAYGGQGAPKSVSLLVEEMICSANLSFSLYPGLTYGASIAINGFASDALKQLYLPKMADGSWAGTMCLTEPHCGTDLGLMRSRAEPQGDGRYKITGTKIFITSGEHDLTENIVHLVLAKLPDGPPGIKGISLFLVPKFLPQADGTLGARNGVACAALEHKMGIKASATCVMNFDGATGWLMGEKHKGLRAMFAMMNTERLSVGIQGLGVAEASYQGAVAYARTRLQGRAPSGAKQPALAADPLTVHPDVRRMLLTQRAYVEGCRALAGWTARALDESQHHPDARQRETASDLVAVMTPVVKAFMTDMGHEMAHVGMQVLGGHGYIRDHGMEQLARDARIAQLYEGTNGIQALDLVGRKLPAMQGKHLRSVFHPISGYLEALAGRPEMAEFARPLATVFGHLQEATLHVARASGQRPEETGVAAVDYLRLMGFCVLAYLWARMAEISLPKAGRDGFYQAKLATARFFMQRLLPQSVGHFEAVMAGAASLMAFDEGHF